MLVPRCVHGCHEAQKGGLVGFRAIPHVFASSPRSGSTSSCDVRGLLRGGQLAVGPSIERKADSAEALLANLVHHDVAALNSANALSEKDGIVEKKRIFSIQLAFWRHLAARFYL